MRRMLLIGFFSIFSGYSFANDCSNFPQSNGPIDVTKVIDGIEIRIVADFSINKFTGTGIYDPANAHYHNLDNTRIFANGISVNVTSVSLEKILVSLGYEGTGYKTMKCVGYLNRTPLLNEYFTIESASKTCGVVDLDLKIIPYHRVCSNFVY